MSPFRSCFRHRLSDFISLRRSLGYKFRDQADVLRAFDRFAYDQGHAGGLTLELVGRFVAEDPIGSADKQARRYRVLRQFADYLASFEASTPVLAPDRGRRPKARPPAYIYSDKELDRLLSEALQISRQHPVRGLAIHAMVGLAASTGLRLGELVRLDKLDVDLRAGVLTIRQTKFAKDRLVPVHPTTLEVLRRYALRRDAHFPRRGPAFFINTFGRRYARGTVQGDFRELCKRAGLRNERGHGPRFHDLRHRFAVRRLASWYREGVDVQAMLPVLATYMGHVHYTNTALYLRTAAELLGLAAHRFEQFLAPAEVEL